MRLAGYLRVGTRAREGRSLADQRAVIEEWAAANGHDVVIFEDPAVGGAAPLDTRKGLLRALGCLYRGDVAGIVVARLDVLTPDLILQETLLLEVRRHGGVVLSTVEVESDLLRRDDPGDPSRRLIRRVIGAVVDYQRSTGRLYLEVGRRRKADAGGYAGGRPRYGWEARDGELVEVPKEQTVVKRIRLSRTGLHMSFPAIAAALNADGVPGPDGGRWHQRAVHRVVKAEGLPTKAYRRRKKKRKPRPVLQQPRKAAPKKKPVRVRRNADGKAIVPNVDWRGTTEGKPW